MMFQFFLFDFSANISNKSFIIKYDLRCDFWCFIIDVWNEFDENVSNMILKSWWYVDLIVDNAIDAIEKSIENVIKQMICVFVINLNKCDDDVDDLNVIDETNEKNDVIDKLL